MEMSELWHVCIDNETGKRFCYYGFWDALTFTLDGEYVPVSEGKTEVPLEEWTEVELCWMIAGCMKMAGIRRLSNLPRISIKAMKECGVEGKQRLEVLHKMLDAVQGCM